MANLNMKMHSSWWRDEFQYRFRYFVWQKLGWRGVFGLLLIIANLSYLLFILVPKKNELNQLQIKVSTLANTPRQTRGNQQDNVTTDNVTAFYETLPSYLEANNKVNEVLTIASATGLAVNKAAYEKLVSGSKIIQYQIKLPITGSYVQIRQFINEVLNATPAIALSEISLKREDITNESVNAVLQFNLYLKNEKHE